MENTEDILSNTIDLDVEKEINSSLKKKGISKKRFFHVFKKYKKKGEKTIKNEKETMDYIEKALNLCERLSRIPQIGVIFEDLPIVCYMISDYVHGAYKEVPLATVISLLGAIIYLLSPIQLIPNIIPILGFADDAAIFLLVLSAADNDIKAYQGWKQEQLAIEMYNENEFCDEGVK